MFSLIPYRRTARALRRMAENPFEVMRRNMESFFGPFFEGWPMLPEMEREEFWGITTEEKEKEVVYRFELPGFEVNELVVNLVENVLTVEAVHPVPEGKEGEERKARRVMTLPPNLMLEKLEACYRNGVLEVHVPRAPEAVGRKVEVKA